MTPVPLHHTGPKFGRRPRAHDARIPKYHELRKELVLSPPSIDYSVGMPRALGEMWNDSLGDCTCAAVGHAIQTWSCNANPPIVTPSDDQILALYEATGGYVPGDPSTDNGCVEQTVLQYWLNNAVDANRLAAYIEIDPSNYANVKQSIYECGVVYSGFNVPNYLMSYTAPGSVWDVHPNLDNGNAGGHCVVHVGYDVDGNMTIISWGAFYTMTVAFWNAFVDEAYGLVNPEWLRGTGQTPAGLSLPQLEAAMTPLKFTPSSGDRRQHRRKRRHRARVTL